MNSSGIWKKIPGKTGSLYFMEDPVLGIALFATLLLQPVSALGGIVAAGTAYLYSRRLYPSRASRLPEVLNAGLWGLLLGWMLPLSLRFILLAGCGGILLAGLTFLLAEALYRLRGSGLVLSLPFTLAAMLTAWLLPDALPPVGQTDTALHIRFFQSLSLVTFVPHPVTGVLLWMFLMRRSPWLALMAATGFLAGWIGEGLVLNADMPPPTLLSSLNYILTAMALGGGLIPVDAKTPLRLGTGLAVTVILQMAFVRILGVHSWVPVTFSFNLITLSVFHVGRFGSLHPDWLDTQLSPEQRAAKRKATALRFPSAPVPLALPVLGPWTVYQGENGSWTHQHAWKYAIDLVLTGADGSRHRGNPREMTSYLAWDKPIVAPAAGIVEVAVGQRPDLAIGQVDTEANWGNHVILRTPAGVRVMLAHLKQGSLQVVEGQAVQVGDWIGSCGNSGYSPEPHLHLHVQALPGAGAATLPFTLQGLAIDGILGVPRMPHQEQVVESRESESLLVAAASYPLGLKLEVTPPEGTAIPFTVSMRMDGGFQFESERGRLPFLRSHGIHTFLEPEGSEPFFDLLYRALPSLPLHARIGDRWFDSPTQLKCSNWLPLSPLIFFRNRQVEPTELKRIGRTRIESSVAEEHFLLDLNPDLGIQTLQTAKGTWSINLSPTSRPPPSSATPSETRSASHTPL